LGGDADFRFAQAVERELGIPVSTHYEERLPTTRILLLCVKPAHVEAALRRLAQSGLGPDTLLISIAAGISTKRLEELLGTVNPWIRGMPNTPSVIGESMIVICGGQHATPEQMERAQALFAAVGQCRQVDEQHFNAITALSGSGPAYLYLNIEAMADAGVRVGLPRKLALDLVTQTVVGAARMVQTTGRHPAALRDDVTTPAGCTIGGLLMLEDGKIRSVLARAI
jgi:pyrroline-5-carboxylate reductase